MDYLGEISKYEDKILNQLENFLKLSTAPQLKLLYQQICVVHQNNFTRLNKK